LGLSREIRKETEDVGSGMDAVLHFFPLAPSHDADCILKKLIFAFLHAPTLKPLKMPWDKVSRRQMRDALAESLLQAAKGKHPEKIYKSALPFIELHSHDPSNPPVLIST